MPIRNIVGMLRPPPDIGVDKKSLCHVEVDS